MKTLTTIDNTLDAMYRVANTEHLGQFIASDRIALLTLHRAKRQGRSMHLAELGDAISLSRAAITALADRLETMELAERRVDTADRRRSTFVLTDAGADLVNEALGELGDRA